MLDAMYEAESARMWEEQNMEPEIDRTAVASSLGEVWDLLSESHDKMASAADEAEGLPVYDRIVSMMDDIESMQAAVKRMRERIEQEVRSA